MQAPPSPSRLRLAFVELRRGYDRRSLVALGLLVVTYGSVALVWGTQLIDTSRNVDWFLAFTWLLMTIVLCWRMRPQRDAIRAGVGLVGGLAIEAWGTATLLWTYWTAERPPLWIIPAWAVATLAIDRISGALDTLLPRARWVEQARTPLLAGFVALMTWFAWPTIQTWPTQLAVAAMIGVVLWRRNPREDVTLFLGGALLGVLLEYWGTSRYCWTYYTKAPPPITAVLAHGFASVAFQRGASIVERALERTRVARVATATTTRQ